MQKKIRFAYPLFLVVMSFAQKAFGQQAALPWESPLNGIANSLKGPTASAVALIALAVCGYKFMSSDTSTAAKTLLSIVIGLSLCVFAVNLMDALQIRPH
ncbi:MAG: TrbC/VirB2 family protein [Candidatus Omnitrophica bacterium]|nr:TrbC/VirB2 family protein [Candidatus Omnitrophota bacterium]